MRKKVGILGGTFDPFHKGHFMLAKTAYEQFALDEVWIMPNGNPPHKRDAAHTAFETRCRIIELAISKTAYMKLCKVEGSHQSYHYTYQTLEAFHSEYPDTDFYFIIGADSLHDFLTWREPGSIVQHCALLVACREDAGVPELQAKIAEMKQQLGGEYLILNSPRVDASGSEIRRLSAEGRDVSDYVGAAVSSYLTAEKIYTVSEKYDLSDLQAKMKKALRTERYEHTLGVMYTAESLAMRYGLDMEAAAVAGLLHDCAKCIPNEEKLRLCRKHGIEITALEEKNPSLLHAKLGAFLARETYGIKDPEILGAIRWHTTGKPEMSMLEIIIYMADYIEPHRDKAPDLKKLRRLSFENIEEALFLVLKNTLDYLSDRPETVDPMTRKCYEFYQQRLNK